MRGKSNHQRRHDTQSVLKNWYKDTKLGKKAREILGGDVLPEGEAGAVGEDVDKIQKKSKQ